MQALLLWLAARLIYKKILIFKIVVMEKYTPNTDHKPWKMIQTPYIR